MFSLLQILFSPILSWCVLFFSENFRLQSATYIWVRLIFGLRLIFGRGVYMKKKTFLRVQKAIILTRPTRQNALKHLLRFRVRGAPWVILKTVLEPEHARNLFGNLSVAKQRRPPFWPRPLLCKILDSPVSVRFRLLAQI